MARGVAHGYELGCPVYIHKAFNNPAVLRDQGEPQSNAVLMLGQRRRRWPNIKTALD